MSPGDGGDDHDGPVVDAALVAARVAALRETIERSATRAVRIIAVTKRFGVDAVTAAVSAGVADLGENYAQELAAKADLVAADEDLAGRVHWHFIGGIQRNKVRLIASTVACWHSVDRLRVGEEIARRAPGAAVLVQVNAAGTPGQSGVGVGDVPTLVDGLRAAGVRVDGLMAIGVAGDRSASRSVFARTRSLADLLELEHCSMGMSGDLEVALQEGATMIRVGTALFGPRP